MELVIDCYLDGRGRLLAFFNRSIAQIMNSSLTVWIDLFAFKVFFVPSYRMPAVFGFLQSFLSY